MSDFELFCDTLDKMNCKYTVYTDRNGCKSVEISGCDVITYGGVSVEFYEGEKFKGFETCE